MDKPEAYPTKWARIRDATSLARSPVSPVGSALLLAHYPMVAAGRGEYNDFTEGMCEGFSIPWFY
jgi:hypothetical protein